jgi:hypothetical protein
MLSFTLPATVARCDGVMIDWEWREGCETCLRRTVSAPEPETTPRIVPEDVLVFECFALLNPLDAMRAGVDVGDTP